ncbi:MAG: efflux RND transporter periplasmic adaptor subunit [Candidatus Neomarinimicrobiota bacterium]
MSKYLKITSATILSLIIMFGACGKSKKETKTDVVAKVPVEVSRVTTGSIESKIDFLGNITASQEVKVYSTVPTRIISMKTDVGDIVKKKQVLAIVDSEKIRQAVIQAEAGLESARAQYNNVNVEWNRISRLYKENAVSKAQLDGVSVQMEAAKSAVKQLEAVLATARNQMEDSYITAPISGVVSARLLEQGDQASPAIPIFSIVKMDQVKIQIEVVENQIGLIRTGQKAHIRVEAFPDEIFNGKISKVNPTLNSFTRTIGAEVIIDNPDLKLRPGMFAKVEIVVDRHEQALLIPKYAILENTRLEYQGGELTNSIVKIDKYVFVVQDSIVLKRDIIIGIVDGNAVEILQGLGSDELLVTTGQHNLLDSSKVEVVANRSGL